MWLHRGIPYIISPKAAMFSSHRPCGGDILFLICYVTSEITWSQSHVTSWVRSPHHKSSSMPSLVVTGVVHKRKFGFLFIAWPHVTSHDFAVRESSDTMDEFPSSLVTTLQGLVITDFLEEEILSFQFIAWLHVTTWSEGHVTSWVSCSHYKPPSC